jgi:hypothetical protein
MKLYNVLDKKSLNKNMSEYCSVLNSVFEGFQTCNLHKMEKFDDQAYKILKGLLNELRHMNKNSLDDILNAENIIKKIIEITKLYFEECKNINFESRIHIFDKDQFFQSVLKQIVLYKNEFIYEMGKASC